MTLHVTKNSPPRPELLVVDHRSLAFFHFIHYYLGIVGILFVGVLLVSMYSVFWSLIPQDAGPEGSS